MKTMECSDFALQQTVRVLVEQARRDPSCQDVTDALARAESSPWPGLAMTPVQRKRFRALMDAAWNATDGADRTVATLSNPDLNGAPVLEPAS